MLDCAKDKKKPLVFVTDDRKGDWWSDHHGRTVGPRPELFQEMADEAQVGFYKYRPERFVQEAQRFLRREPTPEVIEEVRDIARADAEQESEQYVGYLTPEYVNRLYSAALSGILSRLNSPRRSGGRPWPRYRH